MFNLERTEPACSGPTIGGKIRLWRILELENIPNGRIYRGILSMTMQVIKAMLCLLVVLSSHAPAFAQQDPCEYVGGGCRPLTKSEIEGLKERFLALRAALPVPDPVHWAIPGGVDEAYSMPFIAELKNGGAMICISWAGGCFPEMSDINFVYDPVKKGDNSADKTNKITGDESSKMTLEELAASVQEMQAEFANRIEIGASFLPHAYLVQKVSGKCVDITEPDAVNIEKSPTFLAWQSGDGTRLTMVFGPRTCEEIETEKVEKPAKVLAPVKSVVLEVIAPNKAEVDALKEKVNRKAFEALLGEIAK